MGFLHSPCGQSTQFQSSLFYLEPEKLRPPKVIMMKIIMDFCGRPII